MTRPVDGFLDNSAAYVALSRATCLERLFLVAAITLSDIQCKPKPDLSAALAWLDKLDAASQSAFFRDPSTFSPVVVSSPHSGVGLGLPGVQGEGDDESDSDDEPVQDLHLAPNSHSNCFHNAAMAAMLAAFDGQPLPERSSCTPSASVFYDAIGAVRDSMYCGTALPPSILVSTDAWVIFAILDTFDHRTFGAFLMVSFSVRTC